jgi:membrane-associated protease RseP (regulator of RpoE activity)
MTDSNDSNPANDAQRPVAWESAANQPEILILEVTPPPEGGVWAASPPRRRRLWLPALLFLATCASTLAAGTFGSDLVQVGWLPALADGLKYSSAVMTILLCHEMGHFVQAWRYGVPASLPYFLPMPIPPIGTLGAVIFMEPRRGNRREVFDIGITGPLAGLVPTLLFCVLGLMWSTATAARPGPHEMTLGSPWLFEMLARHLVPNYPMLPSVSLHPVAMAGWVGLLITALNLFPIGQLDGGHVLYGMLRKHAHWIATMVLGMAVAAVVLLQYTNWTVMLVLLIFLGTQHPPTADDSVPLGPWRYVLGWLTLALVPLAFTPVPFRM